MTYGTFNTGPAKGGPGTWWPHGAGVVAHAELQHLLEAVGRRAARQALASFGSSDPMIQLDAAISVGTAVEVLAKAVLCTSSASLLIERGEAASSLPLVGAGDRYPTASFHLDVKTLGARASLTLISKFDGGPRVDINKLTTACEVRNAATHLGLVEEQTLFDSVQALVGFVDEVAPVLVVTTDDFWGVDLIAAVDGVRSAAAQASRALVDAQRDQARAELHRLTGNLDAAMTAVVLAHLSGSNKPEVERDEEVVPWQCPVCGQMGWLTCDVERGELTGEQSNWHDYEIYVDRTGIPFWFECPVCKFDTDQVDDPDLNFPTSVALERDYAPYEQHDH